MAITSNKSLAETPLVPAHRVRFGERAPELPAAHVAHGAFGEPGARIGALDGLRAIAVLMVLMVHFTPGHDSNNGLKSLPFKLADIGWTGVDLFFVLSGFLITGIVLRAKERSQPLTAFVIRRLLRIVPAYYLALLVVLVALPAIGVLPLQPLGVQLPFFAYVSNFFWSGYGRWSAIGTGHFWSLALEMQFYLLWPVLVHRLPTRTVVVIAAAALLTSIVLRAAGTAAGFDPAITFGWTPFRWDGLIMGSLIAIGQRQGVQYREIRGAAWCVLCVGVAFAMYVAWFDHAGGMWMHNGSLQNILLVSALPAVFSALFAAVLVQSLQPGRLAAILDAPIFKPLARYSYGIYIIHLLCEPSFHRLFGPAVIARWTGGQDLPIYLYFAAASTLSFAMAALSFHLYEIRFLELKSRFPS